SSEDLEPGRVAYDAADLKLLFSETTLSHWSQDDWRGGRGWLGYVSLYTGCRLAELTGLLREHVVRDGDTGIPYLNIVNHAQPRVKTASSVRRVPLHPALEPLVAWAEAKVVGSPLFPDVIGEKATNRAAKSWSKFTRQLNIPDRDRKTFHSLRATFIDALRR